MKDNGKKTSERALKVEREKHKFHDFIDSFLRDYFMLVSQKNWTTGKFGFSSKNMEKKFSGKSHHELYRTCNEVCSFFFLSLLRLCQCGFSVSLKWDFHVKVFSVFLPLPLVRGSAALRVEFCFPDFPESESFREREARTLPLESSQISMGNIVSSMVRNTGNRNSIEKWKAMFQANRCRRKMLRGNTRRSI